MQITPYNLHVLGSSLSEPWFVEQTKFTRRYWSRHGYLISLLSIP